MTGQRLKHLVASPVSKASVNGAGRIDLEDLESGTGRLVTPAQQRKQRDGEGVRFTAGDVLFGKLRPYLRKVMLCSEPGLCSPELVVLRPRPEVLDSRFLFYVALSHPFVHWANATSKGVKMPRTDSEALGECRLDLPSLSEQRRIADFLDAETARIGALLSEKTRLFELLQEKRRAVVMGAVAGQLNGSPGGRRDPGLLWLPSIPEHWKVAKLSLVAKLGTGHTPSRTEARYWEAERTIPWITTSDIEQFRDDRCEVVTESREAISTLGLDNSSAVLHPAGTVVLSRTASVGFSAIMGRDMATSQDFATWTCSDALDPRFLLLCLRAMRPDLVGRLAMGSTHKTIYMPDIQALRIPFPPIVEQRVAVAEATRELERIDRISELIETQAPLLEEHRQTLITAAVTGQLDPSSYREPAVVT